MNIRPASEISYYQQIYDAAIAQNIIKIKKLARLTSIAVVQGNKNVVTQLIAEGKDEAVNFLRSNVSISPYILTYSYALVKNVNAVNKILDAQTETKLKILCLSRAYQGYIEAGLPVEVDKMRGALSELTPESSHNSLFDKLNASAFARTNNAAGYKEILSRIPELFAEVLKQLALREDMTAIDNLLSTLSTDVLPTAYGTIVEGLVQIEYPQLQAFLDRIPQNLKEIMWVGQALGNASSHKVRKVDRIVSRFNEKTQQPIYIELVKNYVESGYIAQAKMLLAKKEFRADVIRTLIEVLLVHYQISAEAADAMMFEFIKKNYYHNDIRKDLLSQFAFEAVREGAEDKVNKIIALRRYEEDMEAIMSFVVMAYMIEKDFAKIKAIIIATKDSDLRAAILGSIAACLINFGQLSQFDFFLDAISESESFELCANLIRVAQKSDDKDFHVFISNRDKTPLIERFLIHVALQSDDGTQMLYRLFNKVKNDVDRLNRLAGNVAEFCARDRDKWNLFISLYFNSNPEIKTIIAQALVRGLSANHQFMRLQRFLRDIDEGSEIYDLIQPELFQHRSFQVYELAGKALARIEDETVRLVIAEKLAVAKPDFNFIAKCKAAQRLKKNGVSSTVEQGYEILSLNAEAKFFLLTFELYAENKLTGSLACTILSFLSPVRSDADVKAANRYITFIKSKREDKLYISRPIKPKLDTEISDTMRIRWK